MEEELLQALINLKLSFVAAVVSFDLRLLHLGSRKLKRDLEDLSFLFL